VAAAGPGTRVATPPVIWLAGGGGYDPAAFGRGLSAARGAGSSLQLVVTTRWLPPPPGLDGVGIEVVDLLELDAAGGSSLLGGFQFGLRRLGDRQPGPVFLALATRAGADISTYRALAEALAAAGPGVGAVKPRHDGKHGHPVLLAAAARARALGLDAMRGTLRDAVVDPISLDLQDPGILKP
jgi:hypothetical protein